MSDEPRPCQRPPGPGARLDDRAALRLLVHRHVERTGLRLTPVEIEVFELLCAGLSMSEAARQCELSRHQMRMIRRTWWTVLGGLHQTET